MWFFQKCTLVGFKHIVGKRVVIQMVQEKYYCTLNCFQYGLVNPNSLRLESVFRRI